VELPNFRRVCKLLALANALAYYVAALVAGREIYALGFRYTLEGHWPLGGSTKILCQLVKAGQNFPVIMSKFYKSFFPLLLTFREMEHHIIEI
jgi:hypothetical protein